MPTFREDQKLGTMVPLMKTDDYNDQSVTEKKLKEFEKGTFDKHATKDGCKWQQIVIHL